MPQRTGSCRRHALVLAATLAFAAPVDAATLSWANAAGGSAATAGNWSPAQVPAAADALVFNLAGTYPISFTSAVQTSAGQQHRRGTLTLSCVPFHSVTGAVTLGTTAGDAPNVTLGAGSLSVGSTSSIGAASGTTARLAVTGFNTLFQVINGGADLRVGDAGTGTLDIQAGSIVRMADDLIIGAGTNSLGAVLVNGISGGLPATLRTENAGGDCFVGQNGTGSLTVSGGGSVRIVDDTYLAYFGSGVGTMTVGDGIGASRFETVNRLYVGANDVPGSAAGTAMLDVNEGGSVLCGDTLAVGDPDAGPLATLRMDGGDVITESLVLDAAQGNLDFNGGSITVAGGRVRIGGSLSIDALNSVDDASFRLHSGTVGTVGSAILLNAASSRRVRFELDSGSSLTAGNLLGAYGEIVDVVVDSSSTLTVGDRFYLGGAGNQTSLTIGTGSTVTARSMECTDGPGATAAVTIAGAGAQLLVREALIIGGDEAFVGGPTNVSLADGGRIAAASVGMSLRIRAPGFVDVAGGGSVGTPNALRLEGRLHVQPGGTLTAPRIDLVGTGRLEATGTIAARMVSTDPGTSIVARGNLTVGVAAALDGFSFGGTLDVGPHLVQIQDTGGVFLGDSTLVAGGTLDAPGALVATPTSVVLARGVIGGSSFTNNGTVAVGDAATLGTLNLAGSYFQNTTGTSRIKVRGPGAGEHDRLIANGALTCNGTLHVVFLPGAALPPGSIPILTGTSRTGTFSALVVDGLVNPAAVSLLYTPTEVRLLVSSGVVDVAPGPGLPTELAFRGRSGAWGAALELALPEAGDVRVELFDAAGRRAGTLAAGRLPAGSHRFGLDAAGMPPGRRAPGVYFARARVRTGAGEPRLLYDRVVLLD